VANREPTTEELRRAQRERATEEHEAIAASLTPDEERQHRRRAEKSPISSGCWPPATAQSSAIRSKFGSPAGIAMICM
jgi:hypothetical protein